MKLETLSVDFTDEQKRYLEGFTTGLQISRVGRGLGGGNAGTANAEPSGPEAAHIKAQDKVIASGKKLVDQEKFKREEHPFDAYPRLKQQAIDNAPPSPADNFRWRYYGLFYVAPAQDSYMCRLRIPNGIMTHWQFAGMADLAERLCGPFCHVTTRANLKVREIPPRHAVALIEGIQDLGLCSRGSGADNIRNVTGTPTAGIDPQELLDNPRLRPRVALPYPQRPFADGPAAQVQRRVRRCRQDRGAGRHQRHRIRGNRGEGRFWCRARNLVPAGNRRHHRPQGFRQGNRHRRQAGRRHQGRRRHRPRLHRSRRPHQPLKARLKYVIDGIGMEKFLALVEEKLGHAFTRVPPEALTPRPAFDRKAHIGVHRQKQDGLNWIGVSLPLGKVTCDQMRGLAEIARDFGDGDIRLTVWQNLLIPGVRDDKVPLAVAAIEAIGLAVEASQIRAGLIACTGNAGCKFAASDTKRHAAEIGDWCEPRVDIDTPLNIHLTGCHHSCAQHYISDIGLIAAKVPVGEQDDTVEGYHLFAGGGFGPQAEVGQEVYHDLKAEDAPKPSRSF